MSKLVKQDGTAIDKAPVLVSPTGQAVTSEKPAAAPVQPETIHPFPDGYLFKFARNPNPNKSNTFVLHTVDGHVVGVIQHPEIAEMICEAVKLLNTAAKELANVKATEANDAAQKA